MTIERYVFIILLLVSNYIFAASEKNRELVEQRKGEFIVEYRFTYTTADYKDPILITLDAKQYPGYKTAEDAGVTYLKAMKKGDYDQWLLSWGNKSRNDIENNNKKKNRDAKFWVSAWKPVFGDRNLKLTSKTITGKYVLLHYKAGKFENLIVLKMESDRWVVTQELATDQMLHHFPLKKDKVSIRVR